ncbi:MAG TPA: two pore domain potassium channel family protein [Desulfobulbus sp.]|nr:two pore domain potassium channel family protein [Desulfobulbus sp.]
MKRVRVRSWSFHNLLVWLLLYLLVGPFFAAKPSMHILVNLMMSAVLFSAGYAVNRQSKMFTLILVLMGVTLVLFWVDVFELVSFSHQASSMILCLYLGLLAYSLARLIFTTRTITPALISGALCLYLIFGMLWGSLYYLLELLHPGSFTGTLLTGAVTPSENLHYFQYFSFVTLTTLGYGDILPQNRFATAFCQIEAIIGQFFMAVLVARFVGIQVAQEFGGDK